MLITTVTAEGCGNPLLQYSYDANEDPSREEIAFYLLLLARNCPGAPHLEAQASATNEELLTRFGYRITNMVTVPLGEE